MGRRTEYTTLRWFSGYPLDGRFRTDANWFHKGTKCQWPHPVARWHYMRWAYRGLIRTGIVIAPAGWLAGYVVNPQVTLGVTTIAGVAGAYLAGWWAWRRVRYFRHLYRYTWPLRRALARPLDGAPARLAVEPDRSEATIWLPEGFTGDEHQWAQLDRAVTVKLGIEAPKRLPQLEGAKPYVRYTRSDDPPPSRVTLADILPHIRAAAPHELIPGLGIKSAVVSVSVDIDSPHIGLSMGSGDGKSVTARNFAAQMAYHGALLVFLDYKMVSHTWARDLPNVAYASTPEEIHELLCWLAWDDRDDTGGIIRKSELTRRKELIRYGTDYDGVFHGDVGPRLFIVCEELNATQSRAKAYWKQIGGKGPSPAAQALDESMFIGREVEANDLLIGQRLSAKATSGSGSADSRENLGLKIFHDPEESTWNMLVGKRHALPPASGHKGRLLVVSASSVRQVQGAFLTTREARELATAGVVAEPRADMPCVTRRAPVPAVVGQTPLPRLEGPDHAFVIQHAALPPARPTGAVTLAQAVDAGLWPTIAAARQARQRYKPERVGSDGRADLYRITDLANCRADRGAA